MKKREILFSLFLVVITSLIFVPGIYSVSYYIQDDVENGGNYTSLESCLLKINSSVNTCHINKSNTAFIFNTSYSGGFYFNQTGAAGNMVLTFDNYIENITIDFNNSNFVSGGKKIISIFLGFGVNNEEQANINITIRNFTAFGWNNTVYADKYAYNLTFENINVTNATQPFIIGITNDVSGFVFKNINVYNNTHIGIKAIKVKDLFLQNVNSSGNGDNQLLIESNAYGNITIRDSFFYDDDAGTVCVDVYAQNIAFINNTIRYCDSDNMVGFRAGTNASGLKFENNIVKDNALNLYLTYVNNSVIRGNTFGATNDNNWGGAGFGGSLALVDDYHNVLIINNTFRDHVDTGITLTDSLSTTPADISITQNRFYNTTNGNYLKDLYVLNLGADVPNNITVWLNHFYGPNGTNLNGALNQDWCVGGEGNFYNESLPRNGGYINETDCGLMNITQPDGRDTIINGSYNIQWRKQSSLMPINYSIYYRSVNASSWKFLKSLVDKTNYSLDISSFNDSNDYLIKVVPKDDYMNGTNENSTNTFSIDNTDPVLTLSPSADTSLDLGGTKDISCSAADSLGIGSFSLTVDGASFGTCTSTSSSSSCSGTYTMSGTNAKTISCSTSDKSGRSASSKSITLSYLGGGSGGGSSSGGGGGGGTTSVSDITPTSTEEPVVTEQAAGESFNIVVDGNSYESMITQVNLASIQANIAGKEVDLVIGESKEVDLNDDGANDIIVTLDGINNGNAELSIKLKEKISEEKPSEVTKERVNKFYESIYELFNNIFNFFKGLSVYVSDWIYNKII